MRIRAAFALLGVVVGLTACGQPAEPEAPAAADTDIGDIDAMQAGDAGIDTGPGKQIYIDNCAVCHEGGVEKAPHRSMLNLMSPELLYQALTQGVMAENASHLSDQEKIQVAEYLTGLRFGERAAPSLFVCEGGDWFDVSTPPRMRNWGLDPSNSRYLDAETAGITKGDLPRLKLKWAFAFPDAVRARSQPTIAAGAVFVGSHNGMVFALDKNTGCMRWTFQASAEVRTGLAIDMWEAGDAAADPLLYFGDLVGNVYAIKARTGDLVWRIRPDPHPNVTLTGTPSLAGDTLIVPISSLEEAAANNPKYPCCDFRGSLLAVDAATGEEKWRTFLIEEAPQLTGRNAAGTDQFGPSGVPVWNAPAIDEKRRQIYVATGDNYSNPATGESDAIMAFDLDTGAIKWTYQATPGDVWNTACMSDRPDNCPEDSGPDYDFGAAAILATAPSGRDLVLAGQKSGAAYALDPDTGELIWKAQVGRGGVQGGIHFGMAAGEGRLYAGISDMPDNLDHTMDPRPGLYSVDLDTGELVWESPAVDVCEGRQFCHPGISAAISASEGLVYAGGMDGVLNIHDSATGDVLWSYDTTQEVTAVNGQKATGGSVGGGAAPFALDGQLYVSSGYGIYFHMPGNLLLVFAPADEGEAGQ